MRKRPQHHERRTSVVLGVLVGMLAVVAVAGMVALWPAGALPEPAFGSAPPAPRRPATLVSMAPKPCPDIGLQPQAVCADVTAQMEDGTTARLEVVDDTGDTFTLGQRVQLAVDDAPGYPTVYSIVDLDRDGPLALLAALFVAAVVVFGRLRGVRALLGLAASGVVLIGFVVPAILQGRNPVTVALVGALAIMIVTLYLSHGLSAKTTAAVVGTAAALAVTAGLAAIAIPATALTGMASDDARMALLSVNGLSLRGLLFAGVILGALGVLDDVTTTQASIVFELRSANPAAGFGQLLRGGLVVGRDHIAATVNTLFLAYAGASLPLLILFVTSPDSAADIVTTEVVAVEIVRTLVGSLGLMSAVPLTTALAAALVAPHGRPPAQPVPDRDPDLDPDESEDWMERLRAAYRLRPGGATPSVTSPTEQR